MSVAKPVHRRPGATLYRYLIIEMVFPTLFTLGGLTVVVLTKVDLAEADDETEQVVRAVARDVPVIVTSIVDDRGLDELLAMLGSGRTDNT